MLQVAAPTTTEMIEFDSEIARKAYEYVQPTRFHVLVRMYRIAETTASGLILTQKTQAESTLSGCRVQLWALGRDCFKGKEWPTGNILGLKEGDWVLVQSYAGGAVRIEEWPEEEFKIINDTEILCRISDPEKVDRKW